MDLSKTQSIESVFAGGGEMRERMRALDWSTTALGPLEQWSRSLRICVRIVLGSGYPMTIYWGRCYTMLYNDACRQVMGSKHPAALGRGFREVFPEMWDSVGPLLDRVMMQGQDVSTLTDQLFLLNRNGYLEECYFATSFSPIPDDTGEVGGVLNTALETTERVIEDRRRQLLRDLASRAAEARTEGVVWRVSEKTLGEHRLSVPFALLYGYRPAEGRAHLAGTSVEVSSLDPAVIDCTNQNPWRFDAALPLEGITVELGPRVLALPKSTWPMPVENATVVPVRLREDSDTLGFLVLGIHPGRAFDDTYRHFVRRIAEQIAIGLASARAYEQEHQRADALAEVDRAKTVFFSSVSHEFRTPLTLMLGPLEEVLPEAGERLGPERHRQLLTVRRNALRLLKLVNTLLDFSRIEAGRVQAVYEPTDLASLTSNIASVFHSAMDNAGLRFSVDCPPIGEPVYVDRDMWEKVVLNLLSNAFKFTFEGEVAVMLKPVDGAVELRVRDTGVGIAEEERERVFERFHRVESTHARTYEGTGIGLALVQELVKLHGGSVKVESAPGKGSTFTVTIPNGKVHLPAERIQAARALVSAEVRADAYADEAQRWLPDKSSAAVDVTMLAKPASPAPSPEPEPAMKRQLIVVADDNGDMREYLKSLLRDRYEVHAVADGSQALEATRYLRPALVLADVIMPRLDGFGLLRSIRDDSALASTPVILLSARAGEESRVEGLQTGADDYLIKPFTARELLARVATHVKMANLRRETGEHEEQLRRKAEVLQSSERNLAAIINTIPTAAWTTRPDGYCDFINRVWLDYTGMTAEQTQGWGWAEAIHSDDRKRLTDEWQSCLASGSPVDTEARIRRFDAAYRWFLIRANPLRDESGNILKWYGTCIDVEDHKRAEEALQASELSWRQIVDNIPGLVAATGAMGEVEFLNRQTLEYFGKTSEELKNWALIGAVHPDDLPRVIEARKKSIEAGQIYEIEHRCRRADGVYRWFQVRGLPVRDTENKITAWYLLLADIDDRKRAEAQAEQAYLRLAEAQRLSKTGSFITDLVADDHNWSEETFRIFDFDPTTKVTVQRIRDIIHPEDRPSFDAMIARAMTGADVDFIFRIVTSRGAVKHIRGMARVIEQVESRPLFIGALHDVTESKVAEEALNRARSELAHVARVTTLNALTASIAHEINQPLASLLTNASICLRRLNANPPNIDGARETAMRTIRDGNRTSDVIARLRALYTKKELSPEPLDLNEATREVIALSFSDLQRSSVILRLELADGLPLVTGDRIQLQQVILNLVRNASEAMGSVDDRPRELLIRTEQEGADQVHLRVKDAGLGFTSETADKLFQAFYTTKSDGMGIGLHVSQSIIEAHHGRLWATANDGPGVTFSFAIPRRLEGSENIQIRSDRTDAA